ncbi:MAG: hypothetical protein J7M39_12380 [Anaerolineae bacterium]|nr:hypothetical protein [Anaerolineae bacterium]
MNPPADGIHTMIDRDVMTPSARKLRDTYAITPGTPLVKREFGFYSLEVWAEQGMPQDVSHAELFELEPPGSHSLGQLGWCEAGLCPVFETKVLEDRGEYELVQDFAGRHVLFFRGRRNGFMPEYVDHPVKDMRSFEEKIAWRMDSDSSERYADLDERMAAAMQAAGQGLMMTQNLVGGYMYLRSLLGPEELLYAFYDMPDVVHACMHAWFELADAVIARHQEHVTLDEFYLAEDIWYKGGALISPQMMKRFLFPYYQQLVTNIKARQIDKRRHLYTQVDTDGFSDGVIALYRESIGLDALSPFEVAAGCDVVRTAQEYPDLAIFGGIDKRVLAQGRDAIDAMLERIIPAMRERGGYIPTCDHGVPEEVPYEDYLYYRRRVVELGSR